ncbi:MAG: hypothetical protein Q8900_06830 [Bacillota bacterium]|nr:hypothetical protein [Bacillota bacterium]
MDRNSHLISKNAGMWPITANQIDNIINNYLLMEDLTMGKRTTLIILISISILVAGCGNNQTKQVTTKTSINNNSATNISQSKDGTIVTSGITQKDIQAYFDMTKSNIIKLLGNDYTIGTKTIDEVHNPLNVIGFKNGLIFYGLNDDNSKPTRIECADSLDIMGLKNGMNFSQI